MGWQTRLLAAWAVALLANGCVCNASECGSTESAIIHLMRSASELQGARAVACRNEVCQTVLLQPLADGLIGPAQKPLEVVEPNPDDGISLDPFAQSRADGFIITLVWGFYDSSDLQIGDELSARVVDRNGDELFAGAATVATLDRDTPDNCGAGCINVQVNLD